MLQLMCAQPQSIQRLYSEAYSQLGHSAYSQLGHSAYSQLGHSVLVVMHLYSIRTLVCIQ